MQKTLEGNKFILFECKRFMLQHNGELVQVGPAVGTYRLG